MDSIDVRLLDKLKEAEHLLFFTGAGISAESGIPTFRGEEGLWKKFKPEELANFDAFLRNPDIVWEWYQYRRKIVDEAGPNPGHTSIAELQKYFPKVTVVTQNVDNLHRRAGSETVYELHGNIERNYCVQCKKPWEEEKFEFTDKVPACECGGNIRPDVVWFGEMLPQDQFAKSEEAAAECDVIFVIGTSGVVYPAAYIPHTARQNGKFMVEINVTQTDLTGVADISYQGKSGEILPIIVDKIKKIRQPIQ